MYLNKQSTIQTPSNVITIYEGTDYLYHYVISGENETKQTHGKQTINETIDAAIDYVSNIEDFNTFVFILEPNHFGADKFYKEYKARDYLTAVELLKNDNVLNYSDNIYDYNLVEIKKD